MNRAVSSPGMRPVSLIRIRGIVQGVGFRPAVWHIAKKLGAEGDVRNDNEGVLIRLADPALTAAFLGHLQESVPPLARIDQIDVLDQLSDEHLAGFSIVESRHGDSNTGISPDAATCPGCLAEIRDPADRRHRYAFTNCTHCGPRLSIIQGIPYDRAQTSMAAFTMCPDCQQEYDSPGDRRFHAQPNACPVCGPQLWLETADGESIETTDAIEQAVGFLRQGRIVAIKGIGGFHLAVDATNSKAVQKLRDRKRRFAKPFALMARNADVIENYCRIEATERELLESAAAPIVLLKMTRQADALPDAIAPGQKNLGFMLPYSPLHHLLLEAFETPLVMTSGNLSDEPQCTDNKDACSRLATIADILLLHDRSIVNRVDDSVVRVVNKQTRVLRRARGYAPASLPLPEGFEDTPSLLALGGELKNSFCLVRNGEAVLSQHMGDLEEFSTYRDFLKNLDLYSELYAHRPESIAIDAHPEYLSSKRGRKLAEEKGLTLYEVQHHHAHIAACLAENGHGLNDGQVVGIALDGLGFGQDRTVWGGEFLVADYNSAERVGHIRQAPMPGGVKAILEPWRNTLAWLLELDDWQKTLEEYGDLPLVEYLQSKPVTSIQAMIAKGINTPLTSSCGRLFDAVAAAAGICADSILYEGQAAIELEALVKKDALDATIGYCFAGGSGQKHIIDPSPMWKQLLADLREQRMPATIATRFHKGLANVICETAIAIAQERNIDRIALSGGVFQNATLLTLVEKQIEQSGYHVMSHSKLPANDGGLALGQAVIAATELINEDNHRCV